ncbi:MAG: hypothetical protein J6L81_05370 [Clostridia bacterium]|nr:hypothetical protein [Clostridia bacterium]
MKKVLIFAMALILMIFAACSQESAEPSSTTNSDHDKGTVVSQSTANSSDAPIAVEPIYGKTRQEAYHLAMTQMLEKNVFPDGSSAECIFGEMDKNRFAVCDVDCDGGDELVIIFTTTSMAEMSGRVYDYDEETGALIEEWTAFSAIEFFDNGYAIEKSSHNQTHGTLWPYALYRYSPETDSYEFIAAVHSLSEEVESLPDCPWDYPYDIDTSNHGEVYCIDEEPQTPKEDQYVDITKYEAWLDSHIGKAKEIEVNYLPITSENISALLG